MLWNSDTMLAQVGSGRRRKRPGLRLNKLLKCAPELRDPRAEDLPYLWAAYRLGWRADGALADNLAAGPEFDQAVMEAFGGFPAVLVADLGGRPQGVFVLPWASRATTVYAEWFPWARPRTRLAGWARLLAGLRSARKLLVFARPSDDQFFQHLAHYGLLRGKGAIPRFFEDGLCFMFVSAGEALSE